MKHWPVRVVATCSVLCALLALTSGTSALTGSGIEFSDSFWWQPCGQQYGGGIGVTAHFAVPVGYTIHQTFNDHDPVWGDGSGVWEWTTVTPMEWDYTGQWMGVPANGWARFTIDVFEPGGSQVSSTMVYGSCATGEHWVRFWDDTPGCDVTLSVPTTAVGGRFLVDAPTYWAPGEALQPPLTIPAGNTVLVLGLDDSGEYYKIAWACDFLWVPVEVMEPNNDEVWHGQPLPTNIVH